MKVMEVNLYELIESLSLGFETLEQARTVAGQIVYMHCAGIDMSIVRVPAFKEEKREFLVRGRYARPICEPFEQIELVEDDSMASN